MSTYDLEDDSGVKHAAQVLTHYLEGCANDNPERGLEIEAAVLELAEASRRAVLADLVELGVLPGPDGMLKVQHQPELEAAAEAGHPLAGFLLGSLRAQVAPDSGVWQTELGRLPAGTPDCDVEAIEAAARRLGATTTSSATSCLRDFVNDYNAGKGTPA